MFIPTDLYTKLPFDINVNVVIGFVCIALSIYLFLTLIVWIFHKIVCAFKTKTNEKTNKEYQEHMAVEEEEHMKRQLWAKVNNFSPEDKKLLREFLESNNIPIERSGNEYRMGGESLLDSAWVISTEKEPERTEHTYYGNINNIPKNAIPILHMMTVPSIKVYKIKDEIFEILKYFYDKTGKICDFE